MQQEIELDRPMTSRHFKALMRKNAINYKRTIFGSLTELLCPALLMLVVVGVRTSVLPIYVNNIDLYQMKRPFYPLTTLDESGNWSNTNYDLTKIGLDLIPFMNHTNYVSLLHFDNKTSVYNPILDPLSPFYFFPKNCYGSEQSYFSPIVAHIYSGNQIEDDFAQQLQLFFNQQAKMKNYLIDLIASIDDPDNNTSITLLGSLLDGSTTEQQLQLLGLFGAEQDLVDALQIITDANNTIYTDNLIKKPKEVLKQLNYTNSTPPTIQQLLQDQLNNLTQQLFSFNAYDSISQIPQSKLLLEFAQQIGLNETSIDSYLNQIGQQFNLTQDQVTAIKDNYPYLVDQGNQMVVNSDLVTHVSQLFDGNITLDEFRNLSNSDIQTLSDQLGMNQTQTDQFLQILQEIPQQSSNATYFIKQFLQNTNTAQVLQLSNQTDLQNIINQAQKLPTNQSAVILKTLIDPSSVSSTDQADLVNQLTQIYNLNETQSNSLYNMLKSNDTSTQFIDRYNKLTNLLNEQNSTLTNQFWLNQTQLNQLQQVIQVATPNKNMLQNIASLNQTTLQQIIELQSLNLTQQNKELLSSLAKNLTQQNKTSINLTQIINSTLLKVFNGKSFANFGEFKVQRFDNTSEFEIYMKRDDYGKALPGVCFGFKISENLHNDYELELLFNDLSPKELRGVPSQKHEATDPTNQMPRLTDYQLYTDSGFCQMTNWVANTILKRKTNVTDAYIANMIVPFKVKSFKQDNFAFFLQNTLTLFLLLSYVPILYRTVYRIVFEKGARTKESMRIMGMSDLAYWLSWYVQYSIANIVIVTLIWAILCINVVQTRSFYFLWAIIWIYGQSLFGLILILQSIFNNPRGASMACTLIYFGMTIFNQLIADEDTPRINKLIVTFISPTIAMIQTITTFVQFDTVGLGVNFDTWQVQYQHFCIYDGILMNITGGITMFVIGFYLEIVMPKQYGKRYHPLFCIGCPWKRRNIKKMLNQNSNISSQIQDQSANDFQTKYLKNECFEPESATSSDYLKIWDLKKIYENGFHAVNGVNLQIYASKIFVLLGHNGAGKTSTVSMLTGLYNATEGGAEVFGINIFQQLRKVRRIMGVCPQYDVLFELLTVKEHLQFFFELKGGNPFIKEQEIAQLIQDFGLLPYQNAQAFTLSGGNKRKLSVAISLVASSKFVLLDEPTAGMDLTARRQMWNTLKEYKKNRIIVLTTHYMDEADILGDRIGIMAKGKLTCLGSSTFLKQKFGTGYLLSIVKQSNTPNDELLQYIRDNLGQDVKIQSQIHQEITLQIPSHYQSFFGTFFSQFDQMQIKLGIESYSITLSTLEEVFLKVGHLEDPTMYLEAQHKLETTLDSEHQVQVDYNVSANQSFKKCLEAILIKRLNIYRSSQQVINEIILPIVLLFIAVFLTKTLPNFQSQSRLQTTTRLPLPQQLLMNSQPIIGNNSLTQYIPDSFNIIQTENKTFKEFGDETYEQGLTKLHPYMYGSYQIYESSQAQQQYKVVTFINTTSQDAAGLYSQFINQAILKLATNDLDFNFNVRLSPFPPTLDNKYINQKLNSGVILLATAIIYSVTLTPIVSYLTYERISGLKHLQVISGLNLGAYWIGNYIIDLLKLMIIVGVTIGLFKGFELVDSSIWAYLGFPFAVLPFTYVSSLIFKSDSGAQTTTMFIHFLFLGILGPVIYVLRITPSTQSDGDILNQAFRVLLPSYPLANAIFCDGTCLQLANTRGGVSGDKWDFTNLYFDLLMMLMQNVVWIIILFVVEAGYCKRKQKVLQLDQENQSDKAIEVTNFSKNYNRGCLKSQQLKAVQNLSFSVNKGECFALLGTNGAGKSTTFKALTTEVVASSGRIAIAGLDISDQRIRQFIGYCPQQNLLIQAMTVEEHIKYFARIKGLLNKKLVDQTINKLGLNEQRKKVIATLSGGNQRKVQVACAIVANPLVVLLDEPSAGMDPEARQFMWQVVAKIQQTQQSAIVLTTHSMEEAEALSTKIGIMVNGVFKCLGRAQEIKEQYGTGFVIELKMNEQVTLNGDLTLNRFDNQIIEDIKSRNLSGVAYQQDIWRYNCIYTLCKAFSQVKVVEQYNNFLKLFIPKGKTIGCVFTVVEQINYLAGYSVSQTTLEQIFQSFAKVQEKGEEFEIGKDEILTKL